MVDKENIKYFVKNVLGCGCPEDVFKIIESEFDVVVDNILLKSKINIGNKLLIYIVEGDLDNISYIIPFLISYGKKERDEKKFNRLRIVLVFEEIDKIKEKIMSIFNNCNKDDKIHMHLLEKGILLPFKN